MQHRQIVWLQSEVCSCLQVCYRALCLSLLGVNTGGMYTLYVNTTLCVLVLLQTSGAPASRSSCTRSRAYYIEVPKKAHAEDAAARTLNFCPSSDSHDLCAISTACALGLLVWLRPACCVTITAFENLRALLRLPQCFTKHQHMCVCCFNSLAPPVVSNLDHHGVKRVMGTTRLQESHGHHQNSQAQAA